MSTGIVWREEEIALLRREWAAGKSAAEVSKLLTARSRNAVIGMVHRLGLPQRTTPVRAVVRKPKVTRAARVVHCRAAPPKVQKSLVLSWKSGGPPKAKPPVKIDPNSQAALVAAAILSRAQSAERRCQYMRERGVNLSW